MANWADTAPDETTVYSGVGGVLDQLRSRDKDAYTLAESPTSPPTGAIRYLRASDKFQEWNGVAWVDKLISIAGGGTGGGDAATARTNLGLGTISVQNSNAVAITGGSAVGLSAVGAGTGTFGTLAAGNTAITGTLTVSGATTLGTTLSVAGVSALNGGITVSNSAPYLKLIDTTQAADEKHWDIITFGKTLHIRTVKDDLSAAVNAITINRGAGTAITRITLNTNVLIAGAILRPDGAGAAITPGNGTNTIYGNQDFYNAAGSAVIAKLFETTTSTQPRLELRNSFDNISLQLGEGSTSLYGANQYSSAIRFNGLGVFWGDLAYFPNGGDASEYGHFRFLRSGTSPNVTNLATLGCAGVYIGDGTISDLSFRFVNEPTLGLYRRTTGIGTWRGGWFEVFETSLGVVGTGSQLLTSTQTNTLIGGPMFMSSLTAAAGTDLVLDGGLQVRLKPSSARYKENIQDVTPLVSMGLDSFFKMNPHTFDYTNSTRNVLGFIAEDAEAQGLTYLLNYDEEKKPVSFRSDAFNAYMYQALREVRQFLGLNIKE